MAAKTVRLQTTEQIDAAQFVLWAIATAIVFAAAGLASFRALIH